ncbi:hypothetical protein ES702_01456 [subsurface metagenome]
MNTHYPRYRCPKTGRWVSEFDCMMCNYPPNDDYDYCWKYNMVDTASTPIIPRWNNKGHDRRRLLET